QRIGEHVVDASELLITPADEQPGVWIDEAIMASLSPEAETWDRLEFMTRHIEATARLCIESYVGVQELQTLLDESAPAAITTLSSKLHLLAVSRQLLHEGVPVRRFADIVATFVRMADASEATRITEAIREQLATELPGNGETESDLVGLSAAFERAIADNVVHTDGKDVLAIELDVAQTLVFAVREALRSHEGAVTFVARRA